MSAECLFYLLFIFKGLNINELTFKRRWTLLAIALLIALSALALGGPRQHRPNQDQAIAARPIVLDPANPARTELGQLQFLGAWVLSSDNDRFGGISGLVARPDNHFIGLGDGGTLIGFGLGRGGVLTDPFIRPLPYREKEEPDFEDRDSESVLLDPATGRYWVSFENHHALRRYDPGFRRVERVVRPEAMKRWPTNRGGEAMARMPGGRFLVFSEEARAPGGGYQALLFAGEPASTVKPVPFAYAPPAGFRVTDAKSLPDGRLLILHRRLAFPSGLSASIGIADPSDIKQGGLLRATELARLQSPLAVDNMEGLAVTREAGRTIAWIISDDNFNAFQRTLLMKFALPEVAGREAEGPGFESFGE